MAKITIAEAVSMIETDLNRSHAEFRITEDLNISIKKLFSQGVQEITAEEVQEILHSNATPIEILIKYNKLYYADNDYTNEIKQFMIHKAVNKLVAAETSVEIANILQDNFKILYGQELVLSTELNIGQDTNIALQMLQWAAVFTQEDLQKYATDNSIMFTPYEYQVLGTTNTALQSQAEALNLEQILIQNYNALHNHQQFTEAVNKALQNNDQGLNFEQIFSYMKSCTDREGNVTQDSLAKGPDGGFKNFLYTILNAIKDSLSMVSPNNNLVKKLDGYIKQIEESKAQTWQKLTQSMKMPSVNSISL